MREKESVEGEGETIVREEEGEEGALKIVGVPKTFVSSLCEFPRVI